MRVIELVATLVGYFMGQHHDHGEVMSVLKKDIACEPFFSITVILTKAVSAR